MPTDTENALAELATAVEFHTEWDEPSDRTRKALDAAWALVDPSGELRAAGRQEAGCADCGDPVRLGDDLCADCAGVSTDCAACGKPAEGNYGIHRDGFAEGPEVPLCDECGSQPEPTEAEIWERIAARRAQR